MEKKDSGFYTFTRDTLNKHSRSISNFDDKLKQQENKHVFELEEIKKRVSQLESKVNDLTLKKSRTLMKRISGSLPKL